MILLNILMIRIRERGLQKTALETCVDGFLFGDVSACVCVARYTMRMYVCTYIYTYIYIGLM